MGILSAIGRLFKAIWNAIVNFIKKYFWIILLIIIIVCVVYFAPLIAGWLTSVGAPTWLSTAFTWIGANITPLLSTAWSGITAVAGGAWDAFASASIGTKAAIVLGAAAAIAPEETAALIGEAGQFVGDTIGTVVTGFVSSPFGLAVAAGLVWWFFFRKKENDVLVVPAKSSDEKSDVTAEVIGTPEMEEEGSYAQ